MSLPAASTPLLETRPSWKTPLCKYEKKKSQIESLEKCQRDLERFLDGVHETKFILSLNEPLYKHVFEYKGRLIDKAPILHIAMWLESGNPKFEGLVQMLIEVSADMEAESARASYFSGEYEVKLHAMTMAAGLGSVPVLQALATGFTPEQIEDLLARDDLCTSGGKPYYTPLHDACFLGKTATTLWLLEHKAPATKPDMLGMTPLHLFTLSGKFDQPADVEKTVKELVRCRAPLAQKVDLQKVDDKNPFRKRWGPCALTPLELATQHDVNFPKDCMRFLAPSFKLLSSDQGDLDLLTPSLAPAQHRPAFGRRQSFIRSENVDASVSFLNDLLMLCKKSPNAAEELADDILELAKERGCAPIVRQKLIEDAQQPDAVDRLVRLMTASPNAASRILKVVTQEPRVQVPTHYPMRIRTSLGGPLVNTPMRCEYVPDASKQSSGILIPEWFYNAESQWHPSWHDEFAPKADDIRDARSAYDVNVNVLPVPDILGLDFMQALACVNPAKYYRVFASKPVQGIVTCMWQTLVQYIYTVEMFLALVDAGVLVCWGLTPGNDGPLSRLWGTSELASSKLKSPHAAPIHWAWLAGTCGRESLALFCWLFAYMGRWYKTGGLTKVLEGSCFQWPCLGRLPSSEAFMGTWRCSWLLLSSHFAIELLLALSLMFFLVQVLESEDEVEMSEAAQAVLALNGFMRCIKLVVSLSFIRAFGPRIISLLSSMISGAMREMFVISSMVFLAFQVVFLVLRRDHSAAWTTIYLYRGLLFGDGDGLDRFGLADETGALKKEGDMNQHHWSTFYGTLATLIFNIVILNLIIAIYSDEYKEQQKRAPMVFVQLRAKMCASSMLKYHTLGWLIPMAVKTRWAILVVIVILCSCSIFWHVFWVDEGGLTSHVHLIINGVLVGVLQIKLLTAVAHTGTLPSESIVKGQPPPTHKYPRLSWGRLSRVGVHPSVPPSASCCKRRGSRGALCVKHAKLHSSHCLEVKITFQKPGASTESLQTLCQEATLSWSTGTQRDLVRPVDVILPHMPDQDVSNGGVERTLVFEPVIDIWRPLWLTVGRLEERVRLPRFLWMCCRDDFETVDGWIDENEASTLHKEVHEFEEKVSVMVTEMREQLDSIKAQGAAQASAISDMRTKLESVASHTQAAAREQAEILRDFKKMIDSSSARATQRELQGT